MSIYSVNFINFITQLLPPVLRKPRLVAWLYALSKPIRDLHAQFTSFHQSRRKELQLNGQTIRLEWLLNERFNSGLSGIYITHNSPVQAAFYLFDEGYTEEAMELREESDGVGPYAYDEAEMRPPEVNFVVHVPSLLVFDEAEMNAIVKKYSLYGSDFSIQRY